MCSRIVPLCLEKRMIRHCGSSSPTELDPASGRASNDISYIIVRCIWTPFVQARHRLCLLVFTLSKPLYTTFLQSKMFSKISSITFGLLAFAVTSSLADHWITVVNNCGSTVNPTVVDTSCTYSAARCGQTNTYGGPWSQTIGPGGSAIFKLPNNFVGRIFDSYSGGCGSDGWDCSLLEYK